MKVTWKDLSDSQKIQFVAGCLLGLYALWKGLIDGFYPSEAIYVIGSALVSFILLSRLNRSVQQRELDEQERLDREKGVE